MAFVTPVVDHWLKWEIAQWVSMKDQSDDPSHHERTLLPWSYISFPETLKVKEEGRTFLLNETLNIFYFCSYGFGRMFKDHSDREEAHCHLGYSLLLAARVLLHAQSQWQDSTYHTLCHTSHGALTGMRNSSICPPWGIDPVTHRTMSGCTITELHLASLEAEVKATGSHSALQQTTISWISSHVRGNKQEEYPT